MALVVSAALGSSVRAASSINVEGGFDPGTNTFDGTNFNLIGVVDTYDPVLGAYPHMLDLSMSLDPSTAITTLPDADGDTETTGTFKGTYTFYVGATVLSTGTATADGDFTFVGDPFDFFIAPTFTNRITSRKTSGTGLDVFPGATQFSFSANAASDGVYFGGVISPATTVPLPASVTMGLCLLSGLGLAAGLRRGLVTVPRL